MSAKIMMPEFRVMLYKTMARHEEARKLASEALEMSQKQYDRNHPNVANDLHTLADILNAMG